MRVLVPYLETARKALQTAGPYLLLELLLPGGTMFALLLFLYRRKGSKLARFVERIVRVADSAMVKRVTERVMLPLDMYRWARQMDDGCDRSRDGLEAFDMVPRRASVCCRPRAPKVTPLKGEVIAVHF